MTQRTQSKKPAVAANHVWRWTSEDGRETKLKTVAYVNETDAQLKACGALAHWWEGHWDLVKTIMESDRFECVGVQLRDGRMMLAGQSWECYCGHDKSWVLHKLGHVTVDYNGEGKFSSDESALFGLSFAAATMRTGLRWRQVGVKPPFELCHDCSAPAPEPGAECMPCKAKAAASRWPYGPGYDRHAAIANIQSMDSAVKDLLARTRGSIQTVNPLATPAQALEYFKSKGYEFPATKHSPAPVEDGWQVHSFSFGTLDPKHTDCHSFPRTTAPCAIGVDHGNTVEIDKSGAIFKVPYDGAVTLGDASKFPHPNTSQFVENGHIYAHEEMNTRPPPKVDRLQSCRQIDSLFAADAAKTPRFAKARKYVVMAKMESVRPPCVPSELEVRARLERLHQYQALMDKGWRSERAAEEVAHSDGFVAGSMASEVELYERGKTL